MASPAKYSSSDSANAKRQWTFTLDVGFPQMLFGSSKHLFVVARIALSLGIRLPVRSAAGATTTKRIPT